MAQQTLRCGFILLPIKSTGPAEVVNFGDDLLLNTSDSGVAATLAAAWQLGNVGEYDNCFLTMVAFGLSWLFSANRA